MSTITIPIHSHTENEREAVIGTLDMPSDILILEIAMPQQSGAEIAHILNNLDDMSSSPTVILVSKMEISARSNPMLAKTQDVIIQRIEYGSALVAALSFQQFLAYLFSWQQLVHPYLAGYIFIASAGMFLTAYLANERNN